MDKLQIQHAIDQIEINGLYEGHFWEELKAHLIKTNSTDYDELKAEYDDQCRSFDELEKKHDTLERKHVRLKSEINNLLK